MKITIHIRQFVIASAVLIVFFFLASVLVNYEHIVEHHGFLLGLVPKFDLNGEQNLPTWYQVVTLLLAGVLAGFIAADKRRQRQTFAKRWTVLSAIFTFMSIDEFASIHELLGDEVLAPKLHTEGKIYNPWLLLAVPLLVVFAAAYLRFFFALSTAEKKRFFLAAFVYLMGVVVIESIGGAYSYHHGQQNMVSVVLNGIEEVFEMIGVLLLNVALLRYIAEHLRDSSVSLQVADD